MTMKKKALAVVICVAMMAAGALATYAYLTDTDSNVNTFTVGKVDITLDEAAVNTDGEYVTDETNRVKGNAYHLLPGHTYIKDPTVTVVGDSEESYVRMIVTVENMDKLKAALPNEGATSKYYAADGTFLLQMLCNGWDSSKWEFYGYADGIKTLEDNSVIQTGVYEFRYFETVEKSATDTKMDALFDSITVPGEIDNTHLAHLDAVNIVVEAHAIQADGFDTAAEAWAAF